MKGVFITGTDTGIGKTRVSVALLHALHAQGVCVAGMKPVASGCELIEGQLRNEDALALQAASSLPVPYELVNPCALEIPAAPHLVATQSGQVIDLERIRCAYQELSARHDCVIVEGVGGWRVPLGPDSDLGDLPKMLGLPVICVAGIRLGCINHSLLTLESVLHSGVTFLGWIANCVDPDVLFQDEIIADLEARIPFPLLGRLPFCRPEEQFQEGWLDIIRLVRMFEYRANSIRAPFQRDI